MIIQPVYHETLPAWETVPKNPKTEAEWIVVLTFLRREDLPSELLFSLGGHPYHFYDNGQRLQFLLGLCAALPF